MTSPIRLMAATLLLALTGPAPVRAADACDALTARVIRATGASLAGREGAGAVFRAADAERMSLACGPRKRMVFASLDREPGRRFFALIGLAAGPLTGAPAEAVETLALILHQDSLLAGAPRQGRTGRAALRCETGPREDSLGASLTVCTLVPNRPAPSRRRAGLFPGASAG